MTEELRGDDVIHGENSSGTNGVESSDDEESARVTPDGEPGSLRIKISLGKGKDLSAK